VFGIASHEQLVLVFGGSLGSRTINTAALEASTARASGSCTFCGARDWPELRQRPRAPGYDLREYLERSSFAQALAASDLVVARAGGSIFEIAAYGRPRSWCRSRPRPPITRARTPPGWRAPERPS